MAQKLQDVLDIQNPEFQKQAQGKVFTVTDPGLEQGFFQVENGGLVKRGDINSDFGRQIRNNFSADQIAEVSQRGGISGGGFFSGGQTSDLFKFFKQTPTQAVGQPNEPANAEQQVFQNFFSEQRAKGIAPDQIRKNFSELQQLRSPESFQTQAGGDLASSVPPQQVNAPLNVGSPNTLNQILSPDLLKEYSPEQYERLASGAVVLKEGVTPKPGTTKAITPESLTQESSINLSASDIASNQSSTQADALVAGAVNTSAEVQKSLATAQETETDLAKQFKATSQDISSLLPDLQGRGAEQLAEEAKQGVPQLQTQLADVNSQMTTRLAEYQKLQADYQVLSQREEGKPITMGSIIGNQGQIQKLALAEKNAAAADVGLLQARMLGLQGQLSAAQDSANRAVELKYSDVEAELKIKQAQLQAITPLLNREDKQLAEARQALYDAQQTELAALKSQEKEAFNYALENNVTTPFYTRAGTVYQTNSGKAYRTPEEFFEDGGSRDFSNAPVVTPLADSGDAFTLSPGQTRFDAQGNRVAGVPKAGTGGVGGTGTVDLTTLAELPLEVSSILEQVRLGKLDNKGALSAVSKENKERLNIELANVITASDTIQDQVAKDKVKNAISLKSHPGIGQSVGATKFSRIKNPFALSEKVEFISGVEQLISGLSLESLIEAKSRGATFGALSDTEMKILSSAATKVADWRITDRNGEVKGYKVDESALKNELDNITKVFTRALNARSSQQNTETTDPLGIIEGSTEDNPLGI